MGECQLIRLQPWNSSPCPSFLYFSFLYDVRQRRSETHSRCLSQAYRPVLTCWYIHRDTYTDSKDGADPLNPSLSHSHVQQMTQLDTERLTPTGFNESRSCTYIQSTGRVRCTFYGNTPSIDQAGSPYISRYLLATSIAFALQVLERKLSRSRPTGSIVTGLHRLWELDCSHMRTLSRDSPLTGQHHAHDLVGLRVVLRN